MSGSQGATNSEKDFGGRGGEKSAKPKLAKAPRVAWADVKVRDFAPADIEPMVAYYFYGMRDSISMQQVDYSKYPTEADYRQYLQGVVNEPMKTALVTVEWRGRAIGVHMVNPVGTESDFQAAFWQTQDRGMGVGTISALKAAAYFFANFPMDVLNFRIGTDNKAALAVAKKLPLNFIGEQTVEQGPFSPMTRVRVYTLSRQEFEDMSFSEDADDVDDEETDESDL